MSPRLKEKFDKEVVPSLMKRFGYRNPLQVPRLHKIVINSGVGEAMQNAKLLEATLAELTAITGQKPSVRRAKKAISNFKLRAGAAIGCTITLRGAKMYEFLDRFSNVAIPRIRDFRGLQPDGFDGRGNFNLGVTEQVIFPEIDYDKIVKVRGFNVTLVTTAKNDEEGLELLKALGIPFRQN
ncbi:MAG: 50S ribosomal protein L5 [candidate division Zixibacteria bacterium RBG_16_50_21]|nr:MAG: 50S ribosomal protein L5 [candidate division Zixibacteria bacterium RBG_16_50_21]